MTLAAVSASCDKVPLFAPSSSTITLTINRSTLPINGTAQVTATVIEPAGTSVQNGTLVTFVSNLGTFDPPEAETQGGRATVTFLAGTRSGTAQLSATSGGNRAENVQVLVGGAAAETVSVRVSPSTVPVTGGTVQVTAVVADSSGNPLPGVPVVFSANQGTLSSNSAVTDASGEARIALTTNRTSTVTATVAGKTGEFVVNAVSPPSATIVVGTNPATVGTPVNFTISVPATTTGDPVVTIRVEFGDGGSAQLTLLRGATPASGTVTHAYSSPGSYTITARAEDGSGLTGVSSTSIVVLERAGIPITLTANPNPATQGAIVTLTVGSPPADAVSYTWDLGDSTGRVTTGPSTQHSYNASVAARTITVTVRTTDGRTGTATAQLRVNP
ncbi:MAG: PKD domain-containing protein [Vicinamibacterales bacterium]|nr:PKD domain-containing protein [Vicinamibacterales bacterium]